MKNDSPRLNGRRIVITGATSGIGRATALALGRMGSNLILVSRNGSAGTALVKRLSAMAPTAHFEFVSADLASFAQVRAAAAKIIPQWAHIDLLINNAGARFDRFDCTVDGHERTFATNHLGPFLLTSLLLGCLAPAPGGQIINVASSAARQANGDSRWECGAAHYDRRQAYAKSKLANLLFTAEFARRFGNKVPCVAVDPGVVATGFARNNGLIAWLKHLVSHGRKLELLTASAGADTIVHLASNPRWPQNASGKCYRNRAQITVCQAADDPAAAAALWELSAKLTGAHFDHHLSSN